jgi:hypothetical protein
MILVRTQIRNMLSRETGIFTCQKNKVKEFRFVYNIYCRSQWPCGLRYRSAAARLLRSWLRIPPGAWMFVCCECCVVSGRRLCDELITHPEESYRLWCIVVCDLENLVSEEAMAHIGSQHHRGHTYIHTHTHTHTHTHRVKEHGKTFMHSVSCQIMGPV